MCIIFPRTPNMVRGRNIELLPHENDIIIVGIIIQLKWTTIVTTYKGGSYKKILFEKSLCII